MKRIILTTNDLNRKGYRILTEGIDTTAFAKNPVMFYDHNTYRLPIGKWEGLIVENGVMTAIPVFDEKDEEAMKVKQKFEDGYLNCASVQVRPLAMSEAPEHLLEGQRYKTVTLSELLECSIAGIPGNQNAVKLANGQDTPDELNFVTKKNTPTMSLQKIALKLNLSADADEGKILAAIGKMQDGEINRLLSIGEDKGLVTDANRDTMRKLAYADSESFSTLVLSAKITEAVPAAVPPSGKTMMAEVMKATVATGLQQKADSADNRAAWGFDDWQKKDVKGLIKMRNENPSEYETLAQAYYEERKGFS